MLEGCNMKKPHPAIAGIESGRRGSQAKQCGQLLEVGKGKETDSPSESIEGMQPWQHFDFSL